MSNIFIAPCTGCGEAILCWGAAPSAICYRCEQRQGQQNKREQERLWQWIGGTAV